MKVADLMTHEVFACSPDDNAARAAQLMWDHDCGCVPIVDADRRPVAMVTDRDLCMASLTQGAPLSAINVSSAASHSLCCVRGDLTIEIAEATMRANRLRRLPVVDAAGVLVGLLSINDLARQALVPGVRKTDALTASAIAHTLAAVCEPRHSVTPLSRAAS